MCHNYRSTAVRLEIPRQEKGYEKSASTSAFIPGLDKKEIKNLGVQVLPKLREHHQNKPGVTRYTYEHACFYKGYDTSSTLLHLKYNHACRLLQTNGLFNI